jgi:hypothetical protein
MRRVLSMLLVAAVLAAVVLLAAPARAGGWAVTVLDPLPQQLQAGHTYTAGYWVLQHGSHPYQGDLGPTGLKLVDDRGRAMTFQGVALREPAHFAAAIVIPRAGRWKLYGQQGVFAEYQVGMLAVPGGLTVLRPPTPMAMDDHEAHWGAVHPPDVAAMAKNEALPLRTEGPHAATASMQEESGQRPAQVGRGDRGLPAVVVLAFVLGLAAVGGALLRRRNQLADRLQARSRPR